MFINLDTSKQPYKPIISLANRNKEIIAVLTEAMDKKMHVKLGQVSELDFKIPYNLNDNDSSINPHFNKIINRLYVKFEYGDYTEWFIVVENKASLSTEGHLQYRNVVCYTSVYDLYYDKIFGYNVVSYNLKELLMGNPTDSTDGLLKNSIWQLGDCDEDFLSTYRSFQEDNTNSYDVLLNIAKTYNATITFDTINNRINFYKSEKYRENKGLVLNKGHYLKELNKDINDNTGMVNRLYLSGSNGISIQDINPTGKSYIEDWTYYLYPFEMDSNGNVLKSSNLMSDNLCKAILNYEQIIKSKKNDYYKLLNKKVTYENTLNNYNVQLSQLKGQQTSYILQQDDILSLGQSVGENLKQNLINVDIQINNLNQMITDLQKQIDNNNNEIDNYIISVKEENYFSLKLLQEKNSLIHSDKYSNDNIINSIDLLNEGKKQLANLSQPTVLIDLKLVDFMACIEEQHNWNKLTKGDKIKIYYPDFDMNVDIQIIEIEYIFNNTEADEINLTLANNKDVKSVKYMYIHLMNQLMKNMNNNTNNASNNSSNSANIDSKNVIQIGNIIDASSNTIKAGNNIINERGIISLNPNTNNGLLLGNGVVYSTDDGGKTLKPILNSNGITSDIDLSKVTSLKINSEQIEDFNNTVDEKIDNKIKDNNDIKLTANNISLESNLYSSKNLADALTEVFTFASNGKKLIADALIRKWVQASYTDSFAVLAKDIDNLLTIPILFVNETYQGISLTAPTITISTITDSVTTDIQTPIPNTISETYTGIVIDTSNISVNVDNTIVETVTIIKS